MSNGDQKRLIASAALVKGKDDDLIEWYESIEMGARAEAMKAALRLALFGVQPVATNPQQIDPSLLEELLRGRDDKLVSWVQEWIDHLKNEIEQIRVTGIPVAAETHVEAVEEISEEDAARIAQRMKKAQW